LVAAEADRGARLVVLRRAKVPALALNSTVTSMAISGLDHPVIEELGQWLFTSAKVALALSILQLLFPPLQRLLVRVLEAVTASRPRWSTEARGAAFREFLDAELERAPHAPPNELVTRARERMERVEKIVTS
jgi:hypothetical protein